ncbi:MAG: type II secretion system protein [Thermodesulfobacteriota bacterium]
MNRSNVAHREKTLGQRKGSPSGFTFVELMVAMTIFAFVMLGAANILTMANLSQRKNMQTRQAETVALGLVENFAAGNPAKLAATGTSKSMGGYKTDPYGTDMEKIFAKWTTADAWNVKRVDIIVGYGKNTECTEALPEKCTRTLHVTTHYEQ